MADTLEQLIMALAQADSAVAGSDPYASPQAAVDSIRWNPNEYGMGENAVASGLKGLLSGLFGAAGTDYKTRAAKEYRDVLSAKYSGGTPKNEVLPSDLFAKTSALGDLFASMKGQEARETETKLKAELQKTLGTELIKSLFRKDKSGKSGGSKNPYFSDSGESDPIGAILEPQTAQTPAQVEAPAVKPGRLAFEGDSLEAPTYTDSATQLIDQAMRSSPAMTTPAAQGLVSDALRAEQAQGANEITSATELMDLGAKIQATASAATKTGAGRSYTRVGDQILAGLGIDALGAKESQRQLNAENYLNGLRFQVAAALKKPGEGPLEVAEREVLGQLAGSLENDPNANVVMGKALELAGQRSLDKQKLKQIFPGNPAKVAQVYGAYALENPVIVNDSAVGITINKDFQTLSDWIKKKGSPQQEVAAAPARAQSIPDLMLQGYSPEEAALIMQRGIDPATLPAKEQVAAAVEQAARAENEESLLGQVKQDVKDAPGTFLDTIKAIPSGIMNLANAPGDAVELAKFAVKSGIEDLTGAQMFSDYDKLRTLEAADRLNRTVTGTGKLAAGTAGSVLGATVGSVVPKAGTLTGANLGGSAGLLAFDKLLQAVGVDPETLPAEDWRNLQRNVTQGFLLSLAAKAPGVAKAATGTATNVATRVAAPVLDKVAPGVTQQLREATVAKELLRADPELPKKLARMSEPTGKLAKMETSAERLQSPQLAAVQDAAAAGPLMDTVAARAKELGKAREAVAEGISKQAESQKIPLGMETREALKIQREAATEKVTNAYEGAQGILKSKEQFSILPEKSAFGDWLAGRNKRDIARLMEEKSFRDFTQKFRSFRSTQGPSKGTIADVESLKKEAFELAEAAKGANGKDTLLSLTYKKAGTLLGGAAERAAKEGKLSDKLTAKLTKARALAKDKISKYDEGIGGDILAKDGPNLYKLRTEDVIDKIWSKPTELKQFLALAKPAQKMQLRDEIGAQVKTQFSTSPASAVKYVANHRASFEELFAGRPSSLKALDELIESYTKETKTGKSGNVGGGSPTARRAYQQARMSKMFPETKPSLLGNVFSGAKSAGIGLAVSGGNPYIAALAAGLGPVLEKAVYGAGRAKQGAISGQALLNPAFLKKIIGDAVEKAKPTSFDKVMKKVERYAPTAGVLAESEGEDQAFDLVQPESATSKKKEVSEPAMATPKDIKASPIDDATLDAVRKVESNNGKNLLSPAGAEGPYQFMPYMAKRVGLKDPYDEVESRKAAKWLLEDEFKALKDIKLALAAYNVGRPAVLAAIKKADSREFDEVAKYLPEETRNYVPKVLNAKQKVTTV